MTRAYLVRHAAVGVAPGTCYGASDVPLAAGWRAPLAAALAHVPEPDRGGARVYTSPLGRCRRLAASLGRRLHEDARLREMDFGAWELTPWASIPREQLDAWAAGVAERRVPGGEGLADLAGRARGFLDALRGERLDAALVFTHAGVIRCMIAQVLGLAPERALRFELDFASVTLVELGPPPARLRYVNRRGPHMGHRLSKIYTRTGDDGTTGLADGSRVGKDSARTEAMGDVDELNSHLGAVLLEDVSPAVRATLDDVQHALFDIGGELAIPGAGTVTAAYVDALERALDALNDELPPLKEFILPGGGRGAVAAHVARATCRRAERRLVALARTEPVNEHSRRYLNRLSDLLFVLARVLARAEGGEVYWEPGRTR